VEAKQWQWQHGRARPRIRLVFFLSSLLPCSSRQLSLNLTISLFKNEKKKREEEKASLNGWIERDKLQENAGSRL